MNQPVFIRDDEPLAWSPHAPAPTFLLDQAGWKMDGTLKIQHLRATTPDGPTRVIRDKEGRTYYMPHWPHLTSLVDAQTETEIAAVAKGLARLDPTITATEIGFGAPLCFHLLMKDAPAATGQRQKWEKEQTFVSYWAKLTPKYKQKALQAHYQDWTLLDLALRRRQFRAAEQLWQDGGRFSPQALEKGTPAWALTEGLFGDIPSHTDTLASWTSKSTRPFLETVLAEDPSTEYRRMDWSDPETLSKQAFVALTRRWLKRMSEEGVNFNATVTVEERAGSDDAVAPRVAQRTAFMQALVSPPSDFFLTKPWTRAWMEGMLTAGYDFGSTVNDPFVLHQNEPGTMAEFAQKIGLDGHTRDQIVQATLQFRLTHPTHNRPKSRL